MSVSVNGIRDAPATRSFLLRGEDGEAGVGCTIRVRT
jgi:hypothetical protein